MNKRKLMKKMQSSVPNPPEMFSRAMLDTLSGIVQAETQKENQPVRKRLRKRRMMIYVVAAVLLITSVAIAAVLLHNNVFDYTMGTTPENAESITQFNLAHEIIGDAEVKVTQAAYDGISLFISYSIRDLNAKEPMGVDDDPSGMRLLTQEDYNQMAALGVGW